MFDGSTLVAAMVDSGRDGRWAESLLAADALVGPELLLVETANILRRLERARMLSTLEATSAHRDVRRLSVELFPFEPFAERIWALRHNLTAYDAWYVAVAEFVGGRLVTLGGHLARAAGPRCEIVVPPDSG